MLLQKQDHLLRKLDFFYLTAFQVRANLMTAGLKFLKERIYIMETLDGGNGNAVQKNKIVQLNLKDYITETGKDIVRYTTSPICLSPKVSIVEMIPAFIFRSRAMLNVSSPLLNASKNC